MQRTPDELLSRLFDYAEESLKELEPSRYQLSSPKNEVFTPAFLTAMPGLSFDQQLPGDSIWLQIDRIEETRSPAPIDGPYKPLIKPSEHPGKAPTLIEAALAQRIREQQAKAPDNDPVLIEKQVRDEATAALQLYQAVWQQWADDEAPRRKTIGLYSEVFALMREMETGKAARELVWGIGVSTWSLAIDDAQQLFHYPLLTQTVDISLNETNMGLEIRPRATNPLVELDAMIAAGVAGAGECEKAVRAQLQDSDTPLNPFLPSTFNEALQLIARSLDSRGRYIEWMGTDQPEAEGADTIQVSSSWVVFARPKPSNWLINDLRNIREKLKGNQEIPAGPLALVTPPSTIAADYESVNFRGLSSRSMEGSTAEPRELYFPLPYNDEQVTIVQRLEHSAGVAVQGPPGTGKTHTIANIICHYLATGKRILVTSRGEQALKVLQAKIPVEVRPLTVALLTNDREGIRQFQGSIEAIQHQVSQINPSSARAEIERLHQSIDLAHAELIRLDRRVNEIALEQLSEIQIDGTEYRAEQLAELLMSDGDQHQWFDDQLSLRAEHSPPFDEEAGKTLREIRRALGTDLVYVNSRVPDPVQLPAPEEIAKLHTSLCQLKALGQAVDQGNIRPLKSADAAVIAAARLLESELGAFLDLLSALGEGAEAEPSWSLQFRHKVFSKRFDGEISALAALITEAEDLVRRRRETLKNHVDFPDAGLDCDTTAEAVERAAQTGKPFGLMSFGASDAKAHLAQVRVNGTAPKTADQWGVVLHYLQLHARAKAFAARWNPLAQLLEIPQLQGGIVHLRQLELTTSTVQISLTLCIRLTTQLSPLLEDVFGDAPYGLQMLNRSEMETRRGQVRHHLARVDLSAALASLGHLHDNVTRHNGPITAQLCSFIEEQLGRLEYSNQHIVSAYVGLIAELRRVKALEASLDQVRVGARRLKEAGGEKIAGRVLSTPVQNGAQDTALPSSWREAWQHARIRSHLESIEARHELVNLNTKRTDLETGLARMYREVVSRSAWLSTKAHASPMVLQALAGYSTAVRKIGQGTGPNAERYRRDAQQCMQNAADAVPCWIMSHAKISESMPADIGAFDLVIVDEASQSDLWALPAIVRAKKVLVVGDDKQVSPDSGFKSSKRIGELRDRFLSDQPYGAEMTPDKSLYDLAARVFAGQMVMLREHFRCVPPIITYSNRFYNGAIQPLRIPRPSERLDPPLVDIFVKEGIRDKKGCNALEAEAIVEEIQALINDEKYAGRTIGVVTLLGGMEQAKYIDSRVRERCSAAELHTREFACGDASTFQGSERDIIFISLVADRENCHPLSGVGAEQRFNVAASRARDRMYLVRSVTLEDLSPKDLRCTLLEYFSKPLIEQEAEQDGLIKLCESGFEEQVFTRLVERGYRVAPQVKSGAFRLDMVVEGANDSRLAIECDGDAFHGPDRWAADMNRQRILERAGWTFWRCFASSWSMNKDEIFNELLERLAELGIEPTGTMDKLPALVEFREWSRDAGVRPAESLNDNQEPKAESSADAQETLLI
ncbi:AAA family ATPase [Pseudomonas sp. CDFA 602]|uniref:AAA domain-containing protein n=1 Tax=Pseudomonas californiensis TaxID=2829823 RepID=UPI001E380D88|nr:AAA domain-containing protein [Pseudomonas californiensis]MCD5996349.1 AAA family ATPase [Pseudomonas californiensis]MCD6001948.1 AAA family ATPase [Pseudomonas californiensis]